MANQYKVLDVSATEFATRFYRWLTLGSTVGDAAREVRVGVNYTIAGENIDWALVLRIMCGHFRNSWLYEADVHATSMGDSLTATAITS